MQQRHIICNMHKINFLNQEIDSAYSSIKVLLLLSLAIFIFDCSISYFILERFASFILVPYDF